MDSAGAVHSNHSSSDAGLVDGAGHIAGWLPCPECDYDLKQQPVSGRCPECGQSIEAMLARNPLVLAPTKWIGRMRLGSLLFVLGIGASSVIQIGWFGATSFGALTQAVASPLLMIFEVLFPLLILCTAVGTILICMREPNVRSSARAIFLPWIGHTAAALMVVLDITKTVMYRFVFAQVDRSSMGQVVWYATVAEIARGGEVVMYILCMIAVALRFNAFRDRLPRSTYWLGLRVLSYLLVFLALAAIALFGIPWLIIAEGSWPDGLRHSYMVMRTSLGLSIHFISIWLAGILIAQQRVWRETHQLARERTIEAHRADARSR